MAHTWEFLQEHALLESAGPLEEGENILYSGKLIIDFSEIVNLSARHMQKAITYARDISKEKKVKVEYLCLVDEKTKEVNLHFILVNAK